MKTRIITSAWKGPDTFAMGRLVCIAVVLFFCVAAKAQEGQVRQNAGRDDELFQELSADKNDAADAAVSSIFSSSLFSPTEALAPANRAAIVSGPLVFQPGWLAALIIGCMAAVTGIALVCVGFIARVAATKGEYASADEAKRPRWLLVAVGAACLVIGAVLIGTSVGVTVRQQESVAGPSSAPFARGVVVELNGEKLSLLQGPSGSTWYIDLPIAGGGLWATEVQLGTTGVPPLNTPLTASGRIAENGSLMLDSWAALPVSTSRAASASAKTGTKKLIVYRLTFEGQKFKPTCSLKDIHAMLISGPYSVAKMYSDMSRGQFLLTGDLATWIDVTIPLSKVLRMPNQIAAKMPGGVLPSADYHSFYVPPDFNFDYFSGNSMGLGKQDGVYSWMKECSSTMFAHEWAHNIGLEHAGFTVGKSAAEYEKNYADYTDGSSVMSYTIGGGGPFRRGLSACQISNMTWLPAANVLDITRDGSYEIASLSSNSGISAASFRLSGVPDPIWLEWRLPINQDVDLESPMTLKIWNQFKKNSGNAKPTNSLLVKSCTMKTSTYKQNGQTFSYQLGPMSFNYGACEAGKQITIFGSVQISYAGNGKFSIKGIK